MSYETETIDKLFLELSQFTKAETAREIELVRQRDKLLSALHAAADKIEKLGGSALSARILIAKVEADQ